MPVETALVAGATGLVGHSVLVRLLEEGWRVVGAARNTGSTGAWRGHDGLQPTFVAGDLCDHEFATSLCKKATRIVFCAGSSGVAASFGDPIENLANSAVAWYRILASAQPGSRVVLMSSQLVYGPGKGAPFVETDSLQPQSPYAMHRVLMEHYGRVFAARRQLDVIALRVGNVFGPIDDLERPRTHGLVAILLSDLVRLGRAELYGGGTQIVELLHADDLARAIGMILSNTHSSGPGFAVFNIHGTRRSITEVADSLRAGLGAGDLVRVPWPEGLKGVVAGDLALDDTAFRNRFNWAPVHDVSAELFALGMLWRGRTTRMRATR